MSDKLPRFEGLSQMNVNERKALRNWIPKGAHVLEIGTADGVTAAWLADRRPDILLVSIDSFPSEGVTGVLGNAGKWEANRQSNQRLWIGPSAEAAMFLQHGLFEFAIVDGEHTLEACKADLKIAHALTTPTGRIAVHDYFRPSNGVEQAVVDYTRDTHARLCGEAGSMVLLEKDRELAERLGALGYV